MTDSATAYSENLGIVIDGDPIQQTADGKEFWLKITAQLPDEGDHELNSMWFRSMFLTCVSKANQTPVITNLIKGRILFADDIKKVMGKTAMVRLSLRVNLVKEMGRELFKDSYYVQVSARQLLSNQIVVERV